MGEGGSTAREVWRADDGAEGGSTALGGARGGDGGRDDGDGSICGAIVGASEGTTGLEGAELGRLGQGGDGGGAGLKLSVAACLGSGDFSGELKSTCSIGSRCSEASSSMFVQISSSESAKLTPSFSNGTGCNGRALLTGVGDALRAPPLSAAEADACTGAAASAGGFHHEERCVGKRCPGSLWLRRGRQVSGGESGSSCTLGRVSSARFERGPPLAARFPVAAHSTFSSFSLVAFRRRRSSPEGMSARRPADCDRGYLLLGCWRGR